MLKLSLSSLAFAPYTSLLKSKKRSSASLPASLYAWLLEKNIFWLFCINWQSFIVWLALLREILGNIVIINQVVTTQILKLACFESSYLFLHDQKVNTEI